MDHSYQLSRPSIETIIDYCNDLLADEKLTVFEFGENCDLVLHIYKDEEFNPALDKDYSNIVTIHTAQDGKWIDDTEDVYVTDGSLYRELERINSYTDMGTCVVITWIELMTLYRGQGYLLAVIRNIAEKFPEYQLCLEYDRKREGDYEESIEKLCSIGFEKILSARSKPRRLSYNGERCIFSKNDHLKLCEFHLPKKKKLVYKIIVFTVRSSVKEMAWYYLDGNEMDLVKKLIDDGNDVKFYVGSQINKDNETTYEEYLKQEGVNITPNVRFDTLEKAMEIWNLLKPDRSWKDIAKKLPSYALSNEIGMESKNIYLVDLSTQNAYHTANDYLQHYYPNDFNPIDYFYNGEKIIIELNDDENRYYLYGDVDEYFEHARQALLKYIDPENVEMEDVHSQKIFAYECSDGDISIITAESLKQASKLFKTNYPERKIASNDKEYWDNGAYLYEVEAVKKNTLYKTFPW